MKRSALAAIAVAIGLTIVGALQAYSGRAETPAPRPLPAEAIVVAQADGAGSSFTDAQQAEIAGIIRDYLERNPDFIRDYLMANPEVIRDAITELERKRAADEAAQQVAAIDANRELLFSSPYQVVLGNPEGDVTLVEFFDYNCTYCRRSLNDIKALIANDPRLRIVLKEFPVLGPGSVEAAEVAAAINQVAPDKYEAFHDAMLSSDGPADRQRAMAVAGQVGIDVAALGDTLNHPNVAATLDESYLLATALGLTGTPTFVVGNEVVVGAVGFEALKARIDAIRERSR